MTRRRLRFVLFLLLSSVAGVVWVKWALPRIDRRLLARLEPFLSAKLGLPVRLEAARLHPLLFSISLENPRVFTNASSEAPVLFAARRWRLFLTPVYRSSRFPWMGISFGKSDVFLPVLRADLIPSGGGPKKSSSRLLSLLPSHRVEWRGGSFHLPPFPDIPASSLTESDGAAVLSPNELSLEVKALSPWGPVRMAGRLGTPLFSRAAALSWKALVIFPQFPAENIPRLPPGVLSGKVNASVGLEGGLEPFSVRGWSVRAAFDDVYCLLDREPWRVSGDIELSPEELRLHALEINDTLSVKGSIADPFSDDRRLDVKVKGKAFPLESLSRRLPGPLGGLLWRGEADFTGRVKGPWKRPEVGFSLEGKKIGALPLVFPEVRGTLETLEDRFTLSLEAGKGRLMASASRPEQGPPLEWNGRLDALPLEDLALEGRWGAVGGDLSLGFALKRSSDSFSPIASGLLRVDSPSWGDHRLEEPLIAYFSWRDGLARFHNKDDSLDMVLRMSGGGSWALDTFRYTSPRENGFSLRGAAASEGPLGVLSGWAEIRRFSLRDFPPLLSRYPRLDGILDADVSLSGTASEPFFNASWRSGDLRLRPEGRLRPLKGRFSWRKEALRLKDMTVDEGWSLEASRPRTGEWDIRVGAARADAAFLGEVLGSTAPAGTLDGHVRLFGRPGAWEGEASLRGTGNSLGAGPVFSSMGLQARWRPGEVTLEDFSLELSSGAWRYQGEARRDKKEDWRLLLQGPFLERAEGKIRPLGPGLLGIYLSLQDGLSLDGRLDLPARSFAARLLGKDVPSEALFRRVDFPFLKKGGSWSGFVSFEGPMSAPEATVNLLWRDARFGETPVSFSLRGADQKGFFRLESFRAEAGKGFIEAKGSLPHDAAVDWDVEVISEAFPLAAAGAPAEGALDGTVRLTGSRARPRAAIDVKVPVLSVGALPSFALSFQGDWVPDVLTFRKGEASGRERKWVFRPGSKVLRGPVGWDFSIGNDLRNVTAGPLVFFGGMLAEGSWRPSPAPVFSGSLKAETLWVNQQVLNQEIARVRVSGTHLSLEAPPQAPQRLTGGVDFSSWPALSFEDVSLWEGKERRLLVKGRAVGDWDLSLEGHGLDAGALLSLADQSLSGEGPVDFYATVRGSPPRVEAECLARDGSLQGIPFDRMDLALEWEKDRILFNKLEARRRKGYALSGRGDVVFTQDRENPWKPNLLFHLEDGDLGILREFWTPCRKAKGSFSGDLSLRPGPSGPEVEGRFSLEDGEIRADRYLKDISNLDAVVLFRDGRLVVEEMAGRAGRGRFVVSGDVGLERLGPADYNLSLRTVGRRGVPVDIPQLSVPPGPLLEKLSFLRRSLEESSKGSPLFDLTITGAHGAHVIAGEVVLEETKFTFPPARGAFGHTGGPRWWGEFWREARWDILLKTGRDTWYRNEYVNARVDGNIILKGPQDALRANGRIKTAQGLIIYLSQPFEIKSALLELTADDRPEVSEAGETLVYLSGEAERTATTLDGRGLAALDVVTMRVPRALIGEIRPRFISRNNPGLSSERVFQRLLGFSAQDPLQPPSAEEQDQLLRAGLVQLVGASAAPFAGRLARLFGISMISTVYEPDSPAGDASRGASASQRGVQPGGTSPGSGGRWADLLRGAGIYAGVKLSDRVFGLYKFKVDHARSQVYLHDELQVVGRVTGNLYMRFSSELDSKDLLGRRPEQKAVLEQQWRFGLPRRKAPPIKDVNKAQ